MTQGFMTRERLSESRERCVGMPKEIYAIADYLVTIIPDDAVHPDALAYYLSCAMEDIENQWNGIAPSGNEIPLYLRQHKKEALRKVRLIPQLVDEIAGEEFAEEFRMICNEKYEFNPPKRPYVQLDDSYPQCVKTAVDWWADAILEPEVNNRQNVIVPLLLAKGEYVASKKEFTKEEMSLFKTTLADLIVNSMQGEICSISVDYMPCELLATAGEKIGINPFEGYPLKTWMRISTKKIELSNVDGYNVIWTCSEN